MRRMTLLAAPLIMAASLSGAAHAKDDLVIGVSNFPSGMHPYMDPTVVKTYAEDFATRPVTAFGTDWKLGCVLCSAMPTMKNGLARMEDLPGGGKALAVTVKLRPDLHWGDGAPVTSADVAFTAKVGHDTAEPRRVFRRLFGSGG